MQKNKLTLIITSIGILAIAALLQESFDKKPANPDSTQEKQLRVVCTTTMITDAIKNIGGDLVAVTGLMGPGVDPHLYRARESDVHTLSSADLIFYNGLHLEGKMSEILHSMNHYVPTICVTDRLAKEDLLQSPEFENMYDPHIWFDTNLWMQVISYISITLQEHDPTHAQTYKEKSDTYIQKIKETHKKIKSLIEAVPQEKRIIITAHDAFGYFGRSYGFSVVGLQGITTDTQAGTGDIALLTNLIVEKKIPALFTESSIPPRAIHAVQQSVAARGWSVTIGADLYSDALGLPTSPAGTYCDMLEYNARTLTGVLSEKSAMK